MTGVSGTTLKFRVVDQTGAELIALTSANVAESPAGSGDYRAFVAAWNTSWAGFVEWFTTAGSVFQAAEDFQAMDTDDAVDGVESGMTDRKWQRLMRAVLNGRTQKPVEGTIQFLRPDGSVAVTVVHDQNGVRSAVTIGNLD